MSKEDLENMLKFADDNNLMQEPFEKVFEMWKKSKQK